MNAIETIAHGPEKSKPRRPKNELPKADSITAIIVLASVPENFTADDIVKLGVMRHIAQHWLAEWKRVGIIRTVAPFTYRYISKQETQRRD